MMTDVPKLTKGQRDMLERIVKHGPVLEISLVGSGGASYRHLNALRRAGLVERVDHPTVKDAGGYPAPAMAVTERGCLT
jgi:hypothetical protein